MQLSQLFSIFPQLQWGDVATEEVTSLCDDSRDVEPGSVFVAVRGHRVDGHDFILPAVEAGAIGLVVESKALIPGEFKGAVVQVRDGREALNQLASRYYGDPAQKLTCVGVTGTNGKTSVTYMVEAIFREFGWPTGVMGTIDHHLGDTRWKSDLTTPGALKLFKRLQEFLALGARSVVFEISSHALEQQRAHAIPFDVAVFTNLSRDHLDYHGDLTQYFKAKEKLFSEVLLESYKSQKYAILNGDDPASKDIEVASGAHVWTYGRETGQFRFRLMKESFASSQFEVDTPRGKESVLLPMPGVHNVYNAVAAIAVGCAVGASMDVCKRALESFEGVPGRLESVANDKGLHVFVDYAHTDHALESVLNVLREIRTQQSPSRGKIYVVFGCGGDRDKGKRPLMGQVASRLSDVCFITSDNPRTEDPQSIIDDVLQGVPKEKIDNSIFIEPDRRVAIERAINMAKEGDVVLIAGKGHEDYQLVGEEIREFDDRKVAGELLT